MLNCIIKFHYNDKMSACSSWLQVTWCNIHHLNQNKKIQLLILFLVKTSKVLLSLINFFLIAIYIWKFWRNSYSIFLVSVTLPYSSPIAMKFRRILNFYRRNYSFYVSSNQSLHIPEIAPLISTHMNFLLILAV